MADISIQRDHRLSPEETRATLEALAQKLADRIGGEWCWDGDTIVCDGRGAHARVGYDADQVTVEVTLPRMLRPVRAKLESKIEEVFDRYFQRDGAASC